MIDRITKRRAPESLRHIADFLHAKVGPTSTSDNSRRDTDFSTPGGYTQDAGDEVIMRR
jgi:hypothetical protein